jgi:hypothetical protein
MTQVPLSQSIPADLLTEHQTASFGEWHTAMPDIGQSLLLVHSETPWEVFFDFTTLEASDKVEIAILLEIAQHRANGALRRVLAEEFEITIKQDPGRAYLTVNDQPVSRGRILPIEPIEGPWNALLLYRQVAGFNKLTRFFVHNPLA